MFCSIAAGVSGKHCNAADAVLNFEFEAMRWQYLSYHAFSMDWFDDKPYRAFTKQVHWANDLLTSEPPASFKVIDSFCRVLSAVAL